MANDVGMAPIPLASRLNRTAQHPQKAYRSIIRTQRQKRNPMLRNKHHWVRIKNDTEKESGKCRWSYSEYYKLHRVARPNGVCASVGSNGKYKPNEGERRKER